MDEILEKQGKTLNARLDINMPWNHCFGKENLPGINTAERIALMDKKPVWKADVPCYACFACINYCPRKAIQVQSRFPIHSYSDVNDRYHHKSVTYEDIAGQR